MLLKERRLGRFKVDFYFLFEDQTVARLVTRDVIVLRAETLWSEGRILYEGIHGDFDVVDASEEIPFYSAVIQAGAVQWNKLAPWEPSRVVVIGGKAAA